MAQLPPFKSLRKEDFPQAPMWFIGVMYILNQFMNAVSLAFNKNISLRQNMDCQIFVYTFDYAVAPFTAIDITTTLRRKADGVLVLQNVNNTTREAVNSTCAWNVTNDGVSVTDISGISVGNQYTITLLIV